MKLFETLLNKPCDVILNNLVLRNLKSRKYYTKPSVPNGDATSNGPVADHSLAPPLSGLTAIPPSPSSPSTPPLTPDGLGTPQMVDNVDRDEVEQVVNRYAVEHSFCFTLECLCTSKTKTTNEQDYMTILLVS